MTPLALPRPSGLLVPLAPDSLPSSLLQLDRASIHSSTALGVFTPPTPVPARKLQPCYRGRTVVPQCQHLSPGSPPATWQFTLGVCLCPDLLNLSLRHLAGGILGKPRPQAPSPCLPGRFQGWKKHAANLSVPAFNWGRNFLAQS